MRTSSTATRIVVVLALLAALAGCGSALKGGAARASDKVKGQGCPELVLATLDSVLQRVYREGVSSERTASAKALVERSLPLRQAVEEDNPSAARTAAEALLATRHMTNITVLRDGHKLVSVGGHALAPLHGSLEGAGGQKIATYLLSVWADSGFASEVSGLAEGLLALRVDDRSVSGSLHLPTGPLPAQGKLTHEGVVYQYTSFTAQTYPTGNVQVYLLKPLAAVQALCGASTEDTIVNTLSHVAELIYEGEAGTRTEGQVSRVQHNRALLLAVSQHDAGATRAAIVSLLNQHIVRLRVRDTHSLLSDVGGPYVLAPVTAKLRLHRRTIGSFVLSIQDDEGYLRLAHRLAGLDVLMYMDAPHGASTGGDLVKNSLGPNPGTVPENGPYSYHGHSFRVITVHAKAFPSGPLTIRVLIPIPYS